MAITSAFQAEDAGSIPVGRSPFSHSKETFTVHFDMNRIDDKYIELILLSALRIEKEDVLSINAEESDIPFAYKLAKKAKEITGKGSYIQYLENGRVTETEEVEEDGENGKATALIHIPSYREKALIEENREYSPSELQAFFLLSDPIEDRVPSIPFINAYYPNESLERESEKSIEELSEEIESVLSLNSHNPLEKNEERMRALLYDKETLNRLSLYKCRVQSHESDFSFEFADRSEFVSDVMETENGRRFIPSLLPSRIIRAIKRNTLTGSIRTTLPFSLFGEDVFDITLNYEKGSLVSFDGDERDINLFSLYLRQDPNASQPSAISLSNRMKAPIYGNRYGILDWDNSRGPFITLGGTKSELLRGIPSSFGVDSLVTLSLPIDSASLIITSENFYGNESVIYDSGLILPDLSNR